MSATDITNTLSHLSAYVKVYNRGDIICNEGADTTQLGILVSGKIQHTRKYLTGDCLTLNILEAPNSFGEEAACIASPAPHTLCALSKVTVIFIKTENLLFMNAASSPYMGPFLRNIIRLVAQRSLSNQAQSDLIRITSLRKRVAAFLLDHYRESGQLLFTVSQSRCEMAAYLNATRPALSKVLAELKKEGIIDYYKDSFKIYDLEALMRQ